MRKYQCNACGIRICTAEYQDGSGVPFKCTCNMDGDRYCKPQWKENEREVATLPKLNEEVFNRPDCPPWAKYAAVSSDGRCLVCRERPVKIGGRRWTNPESYWEKTIEGKFDTSNWQNSLIERPAKLPDWCKVGQWVYYRGYRKIIEVKSFRLVLESAHCCNLTVYPEEIGKEVKQARLRPYNAEEMRGLIGKVLTGNSRSKPFSFLVVYAEGDGSFVESYRFKYTAEELKDHFTIDGKPCGVLEHLENGEWVK